MASNRQNIIEDIKTTLEAIVDGSGDSIFQQVKIKKLEMPDLDVVCQPAAFIFPAEENLLINETDGDRPQLGKDNWHFYVDIVFFGKNIDAEDYLKYIHDALEVDPRRGGYAEITKRFSYSPFSIEVIPDTMAGMITFKIFHRTKYKDM